jgi:hypothetical protein
MVAHGTDSFASDEPRHWRRRGVLLVEGCDTAPNSSNKEGSGDLTDSMHQRPGDYIVRADDST